MSNIDNQTTTQDNTNNTKITSKPFLFGLTWELYMLNGGNNLKQPKTINKFTDCTLLFNLNSSLVIWFAYLLIPWRLRYNYLLTKVLRLLQIQLWLQREWLFFRLCLRCLRHIRFAIRFERYWFYLCNKVEIEGFYGLISYWRFSCRFRKKTTCTHAETDATSAVFPLSSVRFGFAPLDNKTLTTSFWPSKAATINAVVPFIRMLH